MVSRTFVLSDMMEPLVLTAQTFGQRPSSLLDIRDPMLALDFDLAAMAAWVRIKARAAEES
jgi:hypothetical protein